MGQPIDTISAKLSLEEISEGSQAGSLDASDVGTGDGWNAGCPVRNQKHAPARMPKAAIQPYHNIVLFSRSILNHPPRKLVALLLVGKRLDSQVGA